MAARPLTPDEAMAVVEGRTMAGFIMGVTEEEMSALAYGGFDLIEIGRLTDAEQIFVGLTMLDSGSSIFHNALGVVYLRQEKFMDARRSFSKAIILDPKNAHFYMNLGETLSRQGLLHEAAAALQQVEPRTPAEQRDQDGVVAKARAMLQALADFLKTHQGTAGGSVPKTAPGAKPGAKSAKTGTKKKPKK
ncbi:MAG: tetratricopeptide repeat protein [Myxococcaceae bacterium]